MYVISPAVRDAIHAVVDYTLLDEQADYCNQDALGQETHIYRHLSTLDEWLGRCDTAVTMPVAVTTPAQPDSGDSPTGATDAP
ncbi:hypothetical protein NQK81_01610 [Amycolatopsis roodepoortensis]|uniref:hypothetical protein n=1 Tax=Amycolatopsis roodepoortensis TaxID=700274 RepID=UPI00214C39CE|nr:hypothetical protein [Amycolatopsis roodepoortensis]UUV32172.1 hypothetical protein NQK81_01610 [Amycolatopsis roodepoortensis]